MKNKPFNQRMKVSVIVSLFSLFALVSCGGSGSSGGSKKSSGLKIQVTESARKASLDARKDFERESAQVARLSTSSGGNDSTLTIFESAFVVGDVALFTTNNIPSFDEDGDLISYDSDESIIKVLSSKNGVAEVEEKTSYCYMSESYQVDEYGNQVSDVEVNEVCNTDIFIDTFDKSDYEQDIKSLFDLELLIKTLKSEAKSGNVTIDLLELSQTNVNGNKAIRLTISIAGIIDGEETDIEHSMIFSPDLPFIANPVYSVSKEEGFRPQEKVLKTFNGQSIDLE